jgi:hypothetical protein
VNPAKPSYHSHLTSPPLPKGIGEGDRLRWRGLSLPKGIGEACRGVALGRSRMSKLVEGGGVPPRWSPGFSRSRVPSILIITLLLTTSCSKNPSDPEVRPHQPTREVLTAERNGQNILKPRNSDGSLQQPAEPGSLRSALSAASDLGFKQRIQIIQEHYNRTEPLQPAETEFLFAFLRDQGDDLKLKPGALHALKNDVLNLLSLRLADHAPLIALLQTMQSDEKTDPVMRNYATQFLASLDMEDDSIRDGHWKAIQKVTSGGEGKVSKEDAHLAVTALLHLLPVENAESMNSSERRRLEKSALQIASRDDLPDSARLTALQVCGQMRVQKAADLAYELSQSAEASFPLRIAAIATLGQLRTDEETVAYLKSLLDSPNTRLRAPAQAALENIYEKQPAHNQS